MTMMSWRPPGYRFQARDLVKGLCSDETDQAMLLMAAIHGKVELFADTKGLERIPLVGHEYLQGGREAALYGYGTRGTQSEFTHRLALILTVLGEPLMAVPTPLVHGPPVRQSTFR